MLLICICSWLYLLLYLPYDLFAADLFRTDRVQPSRWTDRADARCHTVDICPVPLLCCRTLRRRAVRCVKLSSRPAPDQQVQVQTSSSRFFFAAAVQLYRQPTKQIRVTDARRIHPIHCMVSDRYRRKPLWCARAIRQLYCGGSGLYIWRDATRA